MSPRSRLLRSRLRRPLRGLLLMVLLIGMLGRTVQAQDNPLNAAIQLDSQGVSAFKAGQYNRALDLFQRALEQFQRAGERRGICSELMNIGLLYSNFGQTKKALDYYERALNVIAPNDLNRLARLLGNMGGLATQMGQPAVAIRYLTRAVELEEARGDRKAYAHALDSLGQAHSLMRQFDKALQYQMKALEILQATGDLRSIASLLHNIGATGKGQGDYNLATRYLEKSLEIKRQFADRADLAAAQTNLALIYFDQGKLESSAAAFEEAILHNEAVSQEVRDASQLGEYQDWFRSSLYRRYAHVLINQKKPAEALAVLERGRGQGLARQAAQNRADFSKSLIVTDSQRLQAAQAAYNAASVEMRKIDGIEFLADEPGDSPRARTVREIRSRYEAAERDLTALRAELSARSPVYRRLSGAAPVTIAELKALAARNPDTLYLQWAVGAEATSLLFSLSKQGGIQAFVIEVGEEALRKQVRAWREAIQRRDGAGEKSAAQTLYRSLFTAVEKAELLSSTGIARLVLVGDGPLLEVPFGALLDGSDRRLVERLPIAVSGSFGALTWRSEPDRSRATLLAIADPLAPGAQPLPAAREEGREIAGLFPGSQLLTGAAAARSKVLEALGQYRLLHFATHGALDPADGLSCGLLLASKAGSDDLELLEARDLINMRLAAQLAVLSACETGQGQRSGGEGLLGLTWAFRAAGCPSIVASLWSVDDAATGQQMTLFYRGLKAGKRKDEALRDAMLAVKKEKTDPYYWAAFQINGDTARLSL